MKGEAGAYLKVCMRLRKLLYPYLLNTPLGTTATQRISHFQTVSPNIAHLNAYHFWHLNTLMYRHETIDLHDPCFIGLFISIAHLD